MTSLQPFLYGTQQVRTILVDGEPWFVLNDLCTILELGSPHKVAARIEQDDRSQTPVIDTLGRQQQTTIVNEGGMYEVIVRSDSPSARPFRRWVTHKVLPAIRKTGTYGVQPRELTPDEIVAQALQITQARVQELETKIEEDAPKVGYVDRFVGDSDRLLFKTVAASLGVDANKLRSYLLAKAWIYKEESNRWSAKKQETEKQTRYTEYAQFKHYFTKNMLHNMPRFRDEVDYTLKITPPGAAAIERALTKDLAQHGSIECAISYWEAHQQNKKQKKDGWAV